MRVALVGAGHAHLHLLHRAPALAAAGIHVTLVAPPVFRYSGVATATASGERPADAGTVDVAALAAQQGVAHVRGCATGLDRGARVLYTDGGHHVGWDVLSLNVGSVPAEDGLCVHGDVVRIKPLDRFVGLRVRLAALAGAGRVVVVGSGATGLEVAGHVAARLGPGAEVVVVERDRVPARFLPSAPRHAALSTLVDRGVEFEVGVPVVEVDSGRVVMADGRALACDLVVLATGLRAHPVVERLGLGDGRGVPVLATLQHVDHDDVFAAGDCAHFTPGPLPRLGVHGVRQGPVLRDALLARARAGSLPTYDPPARVLQILDLGAGVGLAVRGRWWSCGRGAHLVKRAIDERWLSEVRPSGNMPVRRRVGSIPVIDNGE